MKKLALAIFLNATTLSAATLSIISPHRKSIQDEVVPAFKKYYEEKFHEKIEVDWIDQGGTENDLRFILSKYQSDPNSCDMDVFWGGGEMTFQDLENKGYLETLAPSIKTQIPESVMGVTLWENNLKWAGSALSAFGIFYNKPLLKMQKLEEPTTWTDLAKPEYAGLVSATDPRRSSTALLMNIIIVKSLGWDKGWETLMKMAANTKSFSMSSSDPIKAVVSGDVAVAPSVDFYALAKIADLGAKNLGFSLPDDKTLFSSDPIAILKGSKNRLLADRFVEYVLSKEGQKLLILPHGSKGGPKNNTLGRMAVSPKAYEGIDNYLGVNPFLVKSKPFSIPSEELVLEKDLFSDLMGAVLVDNHDLLKKSKKFKPLLSEQEFKALVSKWKDPVLRNTKLNEWNKAFKEGV